MTLETALIGALGTLASVVVTLAGAVVYLWKELRSQYKERAKDSEMFLRALRVQRARFSERAPHPDDEPEPTERPTPSDTPQSRWTEEERYSTHSRTKNPIRKWRE